LRGHSAFIARHMQRLRRRAGWYRGVYRPLRAGRSPVSAPDGTGLPADREFTRPGTAGRPV
jgi:hypothetical protein